MSRLAEDLIIFCGDEHRFFELSDALSTGSSMMPQKKNPDPLELVRGKTGRAIGHLVGMLTTIKGLPTGYNKDLQEDKEAVFDAEDTLAGCLAVVRSVVAGLTLNRDARRVGGIRIASGHRRCGLPGGTGHAVPAGARSRRRAGAEADRGAARLRDAVAGGMARRQRAVRPDVIARVTPRVSVAGQADAAIDGARRPCATSSPTCGEWLDGLGNLC